MIAADRLLAAVRGFARQSLGGTFDPEIHTARALRNRLAEAAGIEPYDALADALSTTEQWVKSLFDNMIMARAAENTQNENAKKEGQDG